MAEPLNAHVAARLEDVAGILEWQGANPFRVRAYRRAALTVRSLDRPVSELLAEGGLRALEELPGIGDSLARSIRALVVTGRLPMLERLRGAADPLALLATVPGVGRRTAERLHYELGLDTLEELEAAAHDGRLVALAGFGKKRLAGIRDSLANRLERVRRPSALEEPAERPPVEELLEVDREYRDSARAGTLRRIAPRRFNPEGEAWLPVLHTARAGRHYTALFSNTPNAHRMGATHDWVVVYWDGARGESQATVITSRRGPLQGLRIVRGREEECARSYEASGAWGNITQSAAYAITPGRKPVKAVNKK
jgi:DNA polymerase (family X)